jgi:hypothetical protein
VIISPRAARTVPDTNTLLNQVQVDQIGAFICGETPPNAVPTTGIRAQDQHAPRTTSSRDGCTQRRERSELQALRPSYADEQDHAGVVPHPEPDIAALRRRRVAPFARLGGVFAERHLRPALGAARASDPGQKGGLLCGRSGAWW